MDAGEYMRVLRGADGVPPLIDDALEIIKALVVSPRGYQWGAFQRVVLVLISGAWRFFGRDVCCFSSGQCV